MSSLNAMLKAPGAMVECDDDPEAVFEFLCSRGFDLHGGNSLFSDNYNNNNEADNNNKQYSFAVSLFLTIIDTTVVVTDI